MAIELYDHQKEALDKLRTGSILCGGVGSGKSRTALAYYFFNSCGGLMKINGEGDVGKMERPKDLYIITTARKRDTKEWEGECANFLIGHDRETSLNNVQVTIDSWNNIHKYQSVEGAFFIFDEQRVVGSGVWVKNFLKITKHNEWILLSATPGDTWSDYIPVFIANGFYRNKSEFQREHCVFSRFAKFPKVERYLGQAKLARLRREILVEMPFTRQTISHHVDLSVPYDHDLYSVVMRQRWNPYRNEPIEQASELCYALRRVVNEDERRIEQVKELVAKHKRVIIFYSFNYELDMLRSMANDICICKGEWNGQEHEPVPDTDRWVYFVQYSAGAEGWNCVSTDTMIFFSQTYSYRVLVQAAGRIDRLNTPYRDLYYYHLYSTSSIDLAIRRALRNKKSFNESKFAA